MRRLADQYGCNAVAIQCWNALQGELGIMPCAANSLLNEEGLPVVCETDIHGAITAVMAEAADLNRTPLLLRGLDGAPPGQRKRGAVAALRPFAASPASFLSTRSMEQVKVDVAYSHTNVKLIGISGGISYGALGMTHHSAQDIAALASIPGLRVYLPSDRFLTQALLEVLVEDDDPAYIRVGRNAVEDVYDSVPESFQMDKALTVREGTDVTLIACGELVRPALDAALLLEEKGISARVIDMYCVKPLDREAVLQAARETKAIVTAEEHSLYGGMGSMVSQVVGESHPIPVKNLALPDEPAIAGKSAEVFAHYGLDA